MNHNHNYNLTDGKNNSYSTDIKNNKNNKINNLKIFSLYKNFLKKELPKYSNIETQIDSDKNKIRNYYLSDPLFKDTIEQNSAIFFFKNGFKKLFFGPHGYVTRKSLALRKFYKSFEPKKVDFSEKLFMGSMDLFNTLGNYSTYNYRLKDNQKKIVELNGNFDMSNPNLVKMKMTYKNFKKLDKSGEGEDIKDKILNEDITSPKNKSKGKRFSVFNNTHNLFLNYKNNLIFDNSKRASLIKPRKTLKQNTDINYFKQETLENVSKTSNNTLTKFFDIPNIKPIPKKNIFLKTFNNNTSEKINKSIKNIKIETSKKEENKNKKKVIENYTSKTIKFSEYFKNRKDFKKYINSFKKSLDKKIFSSNNSNHKIRDSLNNFIINNEKYVRKKNYYFKRKMEEPYNEFKEDSKNEENFQNFAKNVDFSNFNSSLKSKKNDKINNINMAFSFKVSLGGNVPVKEYIKKLKKKKEKEKENKILDSVRLNFKANSKIIHNLTISLDDIKKKYNIHF